MSDKEDPLFPQHAANQLAYGDCPQCTLPLQLKHVGKSTFLGCTSYPDCDYSQSLNKQDVSTIKVIENSHCPDCDGELAVKKGRYGMFIGCTNFPICHFISTNQNKKIDAQYTPVHCPACKTGHLQKKQNRFGKFFYACDNYPKCKSVVNLQPVEKDCPECGATIMLIKNKGQNVLLCAQDNCEHTLDETK